MAAKPWTDTVLKPLVRKRVGGWPEFAPLALALCLIPTFAPAADFHAAWFAPRAAAFAQAVESLPSTLDRLCAATPETTPAALDQARQSWTAGLLAWERLSAVALGPVLERRSTRQIDFSPTRPRLIEKALKAAPATLADLERIGTPAKGFPALEWLLWVKPLAPASTECRYARLLAEEIRQEARALAAAPAPTQEAQAALGERVNQWVGGLERLRWAQMEMPARVAATAGTPPDFPRRPAGAHAIAWAAQWDALKGVAGGPAGLEDELRQRGRSDLAAALAAALARTDALLAGVDGGNTDTLLAATRQLADLKSLVEDQVASALGVSIGFSDADGD